MTEPTPARPPSASRRSLFREVIAFVFIVVGTIGTVVVSVILRDPWLWGAEVMLAIGLILGMRRQPPDEPAPPPEVEVEFRHDV